MCGGQRIHGKSLYLPLKFTTNFKPLFKSLYTKKKKRERERDEIQVSYVINFCFL